MTPERWQAVRRLFDELLTVDPDERHDHLEALAPADAELREEVNSLLRAHAAANSSFLAGPSAALAAAADAGAPARIGTSAGVYRLVSVLGRGGMGEVYLATRADGQYTMEVAVKLVRGGVDAPLLADQLRHERQILAGLDHPNIARLLDGGTTDDGTPFLAMELVRGVPIDEYCDRRGLGVDARLGLYLEVCAAVQYAHRHLVVHRDIKPSNVLVTDDGTPKLLDFGIAKILAAAAAGRGEATLLRPMTPEYASPEQLGGGTISTASDVYSLGIVLCRLLTGRLPFEIRDRTAAGLSDPVSRDNPPRPSELVRSPPVTAARAIDDVGAAPPASPVAGLSDERLRRTLRGDLDAIVLKALRPEPERRYGSVQELADDVERYRRGRPILAAQGSRRYRAGKFVARHKGAVAAAAIAVVVGAGAVAAIVREARIAEHQAAVAETERARAEKRFDDVREFSNSLIFEVHDAIQNLPGATPARQLLLDRALQYLDKVTQDSAGNPDLQRELGWAYQRIAVVQGNPTESNLGDAQASVASDRKALALFEQVAGANPANVIDQLNVAMMHRILAYSALSEPSGRRDLEQAMAISARLIAAEPDNPKVRSERSIEFQNLGLMRDAEGDLGQALDGYREYQRLRHSILNTNPDYPRANRGASMSSVLVGGALARLGQRQEALESMQQGIDLLASGSMSDDAVNGARQLAITRRWRADVQLMDGDVDGAAAVYATVAATLAPMAAADPRNTMLRLDLLGTDFRRGRVMVLRHRYAEAIPLLEHAAAELERELAPGQLTDDSADGASSVAVWLGDAYAGRGDDGRALASYRRAALAAERGDATRRSATYTCYLATAYQKSGDALVRLGRDAEAQVAYREALRLVAPLTAPQLRNVPALYVVASADAGLGRSAADRAGRAGDPAERHSLWESARQSYAASVAAWQRVPNPAALSPTGFMSGRPADAARGLEAAISHVGNGMAPAAALPAT